MKLLVRIIGFLARLFGGDKRPKKPVEDVPHDNYPMF